MEFDALAPVAKLTQGLARRAVALVPVSDVANANERAPTPTVPRNPAEVLALLMDFSGSVALAELLQAPAPDGPSHPNAAELARQLHDKVQAHLDALLLRVLRPLDGPRGPALPEPGELSALIARLAGKPGCAPEGDGLARLARELGAPYRSAFGSSLRQAQAQFALLRVEIAPSLHALGPRARRLERIDAALQRSIQAKVTALFGRMEFAAERVFERACSHACAGLPEGFGVRELEAWAADGGWTQRYRERCEHMTKALFGHLRRGLEGLLLAASEAEVGV